jgi:hypothetical protein
MKSQIAVALLTLCCVTAHAETPTADTDGFGAKDAREAYQEVRINTFKIRPDYFSIAEQESLSLSAKEQIDNNIWQNPQDKANFWGRIYEIDFQDGQLKTQNAESKTYEKLDQTKTYALIYAVISFDNKTQALSDAYSVDGVVTLVTGEVSLNQTPTYFLQSAVLSYIGTGAYAHDCNISCINGGQFNKFGNGKNDGGRIRNVGLVSTNPTPLSIGELKQAMGSIAQVVYP